MPAFQLIVKGSAKEAIIAAEARGIRVLRIASSELAGKVALIAEAFGTKKINDIYYWFNEGPKDAPFPVGTLLHFNELQDIDSELEPARGTKLLDGLDSWTVSTLKPGLHGQPSFRHLPDEASAIAYARDRALKGPPARHGGRVYYVLGGDSIAYRVLRGFKGQEQRSGGYAPEPRREFIIVQHAAELLPGRQESLQSIRWVWDHGLSIEIVDPELAKERARVVRPATKSTRYAPGWAFKPQPKVRSR